MRSSASGAIRRRKCSSSSSSLRRSICTKKKRTKKRMTVDDGDGDDDPLPTSPLIEVSTLTNVLVHAYYCPTTMLLVLRAMNALFDTDPAFAKDPSLNVHVVETVLCAAMSLHDTDTTEQALRWSRALARDRPSWVLTSGAAYLFLSTLHGTHVATKKRVLELAVRAANVDASPEHATALLAMADTVVIEYANDPDATLAALAMQWTTDALMLVFVTDKSYLAAFAHDTAVVSFWRDAFPRWSHAQQRSILGFLEYLVPVFSDGMLSAWCEVLATYCFAPPSDNAPTLAYYDMKAAAIAVLAKMAALRESSIVPRAPYEPEWSCSECTMLQPMAYTFCGVCGAPRVPTHFEMQQQEWLIRKLRYDQVIAGYATRTSCEDDASDATLAPRIAPLFAEPMGHYLEYEAQEMALLLGLPLYMQLLPPDDASGWHRVCLGLGILRVTGRHDEWVADQIAQLQASMKDPHLLVRHGLVAGEPTHALFNLVAQLSTENDVHCHDALYEAIDAACVTQPPTLYEMTASGWFSMLLTRSKAAPWLPHAVDIQQFAAELSFAPIDGHWHETPLRLRLRRCDGVVDVTAHPLTSVQHVLSSVKHLVSAKKAEARLLPSTEALGYLVAGGRTCAPSDSVLVAALAASPSDLYAGMVELDMVETAVPPTAPLTWLRAQEALAVMPRLTQTFGTMVQEEWRQLSRVVPAAVASILELQPTAVPLSLRSSFFLGSKAQRKTREEISGRTSISVARDELFTNKTWTTVPPSSVLYVSFDGEAGHGVGPTTEFYTLLARAFTAPTQRLWRAPDAPLFPAPHHAALEGSSHTLQAFETLGLALGRAFLDGYSLDLRISTSLLKLLQGEALGWDDVLDVDASLYSSIQRLATVEDVASLGLYFNLPGVDKYPLCDQGCDRPVTRANRDEYIALVKDHLVRVSVAGPIAALRRGFAACLPVHTWQYFTPAEWQTLLHCDLPWTRDELQRGLCCSAGYAWESDQIQWLVDALVTLSALERGQFLLFVTGSPCLPLAGWSALGLTVVPATSATGRCTNGKALSVDGDVDASLPSCNTCQKYLKLPRYSSRDVLAAKLRVACTEGQAYFALD
ncbi:hypothetical protein SPRG_12726 [Saprolegnia parasitica CBS 223.65]|uniref:HECT domain-containing protein n=1 Tax=Saprolegnia parasitica (strain CBS 223.65) TaxID=695850 RepID=A0A067C008_SAPPC|nr:hypothetical protein SPRG_12726 [Saprolegnia parasitica CBS 223.65]KDO22445.1 hypothetical protein SPRG_12726 [Saprolegnia parasitica CBS 223.65]|eukprot:XP_012206833.1 hypothetical protein SPRG_12726 [Saprolegnia parasitica CBS 223.65]